MSQEQQYYEALTRLDHPVFSKDFSETTDQDSPLNSVINRVIAKQLVKVRAVLDEVQLNAFPDTATDMGIDQWEETYFGFVKSGKTLDQRISELLVKINNRIGMSVSDVINMAISITGQTPRMITRSLGWSGWVIGESTLGLDTILGGEDDDSKFVYAVVFPNSVDSVLLAKLDQQLTNIEKGGSTHIIISPTRFWVLGEGTLGVDTTLE